MLYIRTDINSVIATGHVMRCLAIADAARKMNERTTFILSDENGKQYIEDRGYRTIILYTQWDDMESELPYLLEVIEKEQIDAILIDSYQVTEHYLKIVSNYTKTIYIDDLDQFTYPVNLLIFYMSYWEKLHHKVKYSNAKLLLGLKYTPIREVFQNIDKKKLKDKVESILLLSGGTDRYRVLEQLLESIKDRNFKEIIVICGRYYPDEINLVEKYKEYKNIYIYKSVDNIEDYMVRADLAISAGGTTLYELCACGTPTISYAIADNQLDNVQSLADNHIIDYAGDVRCDDVSHSLNNLILRYCEDRELRVERSRRMQDIVDGKGASRIVAEWKRLIKE